MTCPQCQGTTEGLRYVGGTFYGRCCTPKAAARVKTFWFERRIPNSYGAKITEAFREDAEERGSFGITHVDERGDLDVEPVTRRAATRKIIFMGAR